MTRSHNFDFRAKAKEISYFKDCQTSPVPKEFKIINQILLKKVVLPPHPPLIPNKRHPNPSSSTECMSCPALRLAELQNSLVANCCQLKPLIQLTVPTPLAHSNSWKYYTQHNSFPKSQSLRKLRPHHSGSGSCHQAVLLPDLEV